MAQADEWETKGLAPDEFLEKIKLDAKQHMNQALDVINTLDLCVRSYKDWKRKIFFGLCPECRTRCTIKINDDTISEKHSTMDAKHIEKENRKSLLFRIKKFVTKTKGSPSPELSLTITDLRLLLETKESAFENYHQVTDSQIEQMKLENENLKVENEQLQSSASSMKSEIERLNMENTKLNEKNKELQSTVTSTVRDLEQLRHDTDRSILAQENAKSEMRSRSEEWEATEKGLTELITDLTNQLTEHKKQIGKLENDLDTKDEELRIVQKELAEAKRPRVRDIVLGLRTERSGMGKTMVDMVHRELSGQLQSLLVKENVRLTVKQCTAATDVPKGLLAVLCMDMSRVGTNIKDALAGIKVNRDVFVIVFHHTSKENLSSLTPTSLRITGSELRQLGAIIDMVFSSDSGIYECGINNTAIAKIASLVTKYS